MKRNYSALYNTTLSLISNLLLVMGCFIVCRVVFILDNLEMFNNLSYDSLLKMFQGGLKFDVSGILYTNLLYILMMIIPIHYKEKRNYQKVAKVVFVLTNMMAIVMNLMDTVYFKYTGRRTTASIFHEFENENNILGIIGTEVVNHWYLTLLGVLLAFVLWKLYRTPKQIVINRLPIYYLVHLITFVLGAYLCVGGLRGGFTGMVRPITLSNANKYINSPIEAGIVLNTPFSIYRTIGKKPFKVPSYKNKEEIKALFSPIHKEMKGEEKKLNVVVLILESFGKENSGFLNPNLYTKEPKGYTPFLDSLMQQGVTYQYAFANGKKSIDAMPSILSSIPMFVEPFFVTPAALNKVTSIAGELRKKEYYTAFFHGADNGSMGFEAFAKAAGYEDYYGRTEYNRAYPDNDDFDGHWGIWDRPFLSYFAQTMSSFKEPFVSTIFTLSSHHPFAVPQNFENRYPKGKMAIRQCIGYSDDALRNFFNIAKKQPWFENTLFVLTADHTNSNEHAEYQTAYGTFAVPIVFYQPNSELKKYDENKIAQQIDIMPTVLNYLGYDNPYIAFGCDLFNTPAEDTYAINYLNGIYQYIKGEYLLQFDGEKTVGLYRFKEDKLLKNNIVHQNNASQEKLENELKAIIQSYMYRMVNDELTLQ